MLLFKTFVDRDTTMELDQTIIFSESHRIRDYCDLCGNFLLNYHYFFTFDLMTCGICRSVFLDSYFKKNLIPYLKVMIK